MIFLIEELSNSTLLVLLVSDFGADYKKALKTRGLGRNKTTFVDTDVLCSIFAGNKDISKLGAVLRLCITDREIAKNAEQYITTYVKLKYPELAKSEVFLKVLTTSVEQYGFSVSVSNNLEFRDKFLSLYLDKIANSSYSTDIKLYLFSYLYTNYNKTLTADAIDTIVDSGSMWFEGLNRNDLRYKLDVFTWCLKASNLKKYGLPSDFDFKSKVMLNSTNVGEGEPFGKLPVDDMRRWLNLFEERSSQISLYSFWYNKDYDTYLDVKDAYEVDWKNIDTEKATTVLNYLQRLERDKRWKDELKLIKINSDKSEAADILNAIYSTVSDTRASSSRSEETSHDAETERSSAPSVSSHAKNGYALTKEILGIDSKKNIPLDKLIKYVEKVAEAGKVKRIYTSKKLKNKVGTDPQFIDNILKKKYPASRIDGVQLRLLNQLIVNWIDIYR